MISYKDAPGPWNDEPDYCEWIDKDTGYKCYIRRIQMLGHLCGYVNIHKTHPLHGIQLLGISESNELDELDVHGGVTYSEEGKDGSWTIGFDCAGFGDLVPVMIVFKGNCKKFSEITDLLDKKWTKRVEEVYKNIDYVKNECKSLAAQLKERENERSNQRISYEI